MTDIVRNGAPPSPAPGGAGPSPETAEIAEVAADLEAEIGRAVAAAATPSHLPVNGYGTAEAWVLVAPAPGLRPDDLEVELDDRVVRIRGRLRSAAPSKDYFTREWSYGAFEREVALPGPGATPAWARLSEGVLTVSIARATRGERIDLQVRDRSTAS